MSQFRARGDDAWRWRDCFAVMSRRATARRVAMRHHHASSPRARNCDITTPQGGSRRADGPPRPDGTPAAAPEVMVGGDGIGEVRQREGGRDRCLGAHDDGFSTIVHRNTRVVMSHYIYLYILWARS